MGLKEGILNKIKEHMDKIFSVKNVSIVPKISDSNLTFGNKGLKFTATVLYIDLRGSTKLLNKHNKSIVAKIHKAYYHTIVKIAKEFGGENRSFNGDSLLVFFLGDKNETISNAVKAALKMKYMLSDSEGISKHLNKYTSIDFGIGIDYGDLLCTKVGIGGDDDNKDLFWIGNPVNKSTVLSDKGKSPKHIYISSIVYNKLLDYAKYSINPVPDTNMWELIFIKYNGKTTAVYRTQYHWVLT